MVRKKKKQKHKKPKKEIYEIIECVFFWDLFVRKSPGFFFSAATP